MSVCPQVEIAILGRIPDDGSGRVRTVLGVETQAETSVSRRRPLELFPTPLRRGAVDVCPGFAAKGPWNRVFLPVFELPDEGYKGCLRGRTADNFVPRASREALPLVRQMSVKVPSWIEACLPFTLHHWEPRTCADARIVGDARMTEPSELTFNLNRDEELLLPDRCRLALTCFEAPEIREATGAALEQILYELARLGMDLRALDGITIAHDCETAATALQSIPEGLVPLERTDPPDTMEMGRTVPVRRNEELRFHIVLRAGLGLMLLSPEHSLQEAAYACLAHEAAHVQHEANLYRTFPDVYTCLLECGSRSRQTFLKALDVWSEYAACRSAALFREAALEDFEGQLCRALETCSSACLDRIAAFRNDGNAPLVFREVQQLFGDVFICAGYFLGHLDGLGLKVEDRAPRLAAHLQKVPDVEALIVRLRRVLHELWLTEYAWRSVEVFLPIYNLICSMMTLHGLAFARHGDEWRMVLCEDENATPEIQIALAKWMLRSGEPAS